MYIRIKKRKNNSGNTYEYAYLVSSKYRKKHPKQKVKRYLGRVFTFKAQSEGVPVELELQGKKAKAVILALITHELEKHGFHTTKKNLFENEQFIVNLNERSVIDKNTKKPVCMALNEGILCDYTLRKLIDFKPPEAIEKEIGKRLAKRFVESGITIPKDQFVELFKKIMAESKQ